MTTNTDPVRKAIRMARNIADGAGLNPSRGHQHADGMRRACNIIEAALASAPPSAPVGLSGRWLPGASAPRDTKVICAWLGAPGCSEVDVAVLYTEHAEAPYWCSPHDALERFSPPDLWQPFPAIADSELTAALAQQPAAPSGEAVVEKPCLDCGVPVFAWADSEPVTCLGCHADRHDAAPQQPAARPKAVRVGYIDPRNLVLMASAKHPGSFQNCIKLEGAQASGDIELYAYTAPQQPAGVDEAMVERVARTLHAHGADSLSADIAWDDLHDSERTQYRSWAKAAALAAQQQGGRADG